jgi:hypothetical protein
MKAQCFLCKKIKSRKDIELKEIRKGLLVYICLDHNENEKEDEK